LFRPPFTEWLPGLDVLQDWAPGAAGHFCGKDDGFVKSPSVPLGAGLDFGFCRNDRKWSFQTFYEFIKSYPRQAFCDKVENNFGQVFFRGVYLQGE
jgi:hypothetical protein